jgi:hypothetical protein
LTSENEKGFFHVKGKRKVCAREKESRAFIKLQWLSS